MPSLLRMALAQEGASTLIECAKILPRKFVQKTQRVLQVSAANIGAVLVNAAKLRGAVKMAAGAVLTSQMRRERRISNRAAARAAAVAGEGLPLKLQRV